MKLLRRISIALAGETVLLIGIAMIVLPGPAIVVIPAGLAILALEFAWAKHWLDKVRRIWPQKKAARPGLVALPKESAAAAVAPIKAPSLPTR